MSQASIAIVVNSGRTLIAEYLISNAEVFDINAFAIGSGSVGLPPSPTQTAMDSLMQIDGADLTAITTKTFISPSAAQYVCVIPNDYASPDAITEFGLYYKDGFPGDTSETGAVLFAYATFAPIVKEALSDLSITVTIQA